MGPQSRSTQSRESADVYRPARSHRQSGSPRGGSLISPWWIWLPVGRYISAFCWVSHFQTRFRKSATMTFSHRRGVRKWVYLWKFMASRAMTNQNPKGWVERKAILSRRVLCKQKCSWQGRWAFSLLHSSLNVINSSIGAGGKDVLSC